MLFDTHAHFDDEQFDNDRDALLMSLSEFGVSNIVNIGSDMKTSQSSVELAEKYPFVYATVGVHPSETGDMSEADIDRLRIMSEHEKVRAIGEIGLDYHYDDNAPAEIQKHWFIRQLELIRDIGNEKAKEGKSLFDRKAEEEIMEKAVMNSPQDMQNYSIEFFRSIISISKEYYKDNK